MALRESHLDAALESAQADLLPGIDMKYAKCEAYKFVYDFLMTLKPAAGPVISIGIRAIQGLISKRRRSLGCGQAGGAIPEEGKTW